MGDGSGRRTPEVVAAVSVVVVVASIVVGTLVGDLSEPLWFLLVPIGIFGAGLVGLVSLATIVRRRLD